MLGKLAVEDDLTNQVLTLLKQRPASPNHWSAVWIDTLLGLAHQMAGEDDKAEQVLKRSLVADGRYDHPLTATVLLELGKLALRRGVAEEAATYFLEATYAGALSFPTPT
ncbi:MAG: tetratricopeptide repeat protein [Pirellulales bacterium]